MWFLLVACSSPPAALGPVPADAPAWPVVTLEDGTRFLGAVIPDVATAGGVLPVDIDLAPAGALTVELQWWAPASEAARATWSYSIPAGVGDRVRHHVDLPLPTDLPDGPGLLMWQAEGLSAKPLRGDRVPLGVVFVGTPPPVAPAPATSVGGITLAAAGDLSLGRRMNLLLTREGPGAALGAVTGLAAADLTFANLESAVGDAGAPVEKGEGGEYYLRGRPESLETLRAAGVDLVAQANNHAGDYGPAGLLRGRELLAAAGIAGAGSGADRAQACAPVFRRSGDVSVALFSVDATQASFAAGDATPGTCFLPIDDAAAWTRWFRPAAAEARRVADVVLVAVHWGPNGQSRPDAARRRVGHALVDAGADAILGTSAHRVQGIELHRGRPILYDLGNLVFDAVDPGEHERSALFELRVDPRGVTSIRATPLSLASDGHTRPAAGNDAAAVVYRLRDLSRELGTAAVIEDGAVVVALPEPPARAPAPEREAAALVAPVAVTPSPTPPPGCLVDAVPPDAAIQPARVGPWELVGVRYAPRTTKVRDHVTAESWWRVVEPAAAETQIASVLVGRDGDRNWDTVQQPCDWGWPADRAPVGAIVHEVSQVRPPQRLRPQTYDLELALVVGPSTLGVVGALGEVVFQP